MDKSDSYRLSLSALSARLSGERDRTANMANFSALMAEGMEDINWLGFYIFNGSELVLGPFQGRAAVSRISTDKGVCGAAFSRGETLIVNDVHAFPGHIACDSRSRSEIVLPLRKDGRLLGVLDIDSPLPGRFDSCDRLWLERAAELLVAASDF